MPKRVWLRSKISVRRSFATNEPCFIATGSREVIGAAVRGELVACETIVMHVPRINGGLVRWSVVFDIADKQQMRHCFSAIDRCGLLPNGLKMWHRAIKGRDLNGDFLAKEKNRYWAKLSMWKVARGSVADEIV